LKKETEKETAIIRLSPFLLYFITQDLHNPLHRWLLFLRRDTVKQPNLKEVFILDQLVAKAEDKLRRLSADEETIRMYQLREKFIDDQKTQIDGAKNEKAIEIAKSLLKIPSMCIQDVANHTGLPLQKVKDIEKEVR
jgi:predicted transposase/invertase (TIGR01784 family)